MRARKAAALGLYCAAAILLSYVELLIPPLSAVPGVKLGLANLAVVTALYFYSWREAALVSCVRVAAAGLLFGNVFSVAFSLTGGTLSLLAMTLVKRSSRFDCTGVSLTGAIAHNAGQVAAAAVLVENARVAVYFVPLAVTGLLAGTAIGLLSGLLLRRLEKLIPKW